MNIFGCGLTQQQCVDQLTSTFGDEALHRATVFRWFAEFSRGRHVTYREIEASLGISSTSVHSILHEHLVIKKICSRWIPHNLTIAQKKGRVKWYTEILKKYDHGTSKDVFFFIFCCGRGRIMDLLFIIMHMTRKISSSRLCGFFKVSQTQQQLSVHEALRNKWAPVFLE